MARATADATAPPMLELATCCISMMKGKTSAMPASASAPRRPTKCASTVAVTAISTTLTTTLGAARRRSVEVIGPSSRARVRGTARAGDRLVAGAPAEARATTLVCLMGGLLPRHVRAPLLSGQSFVPIPWHVCVIHITNHVQCLGPQPAHPQLHPAHARLARPEGQRLRSAPRRRLSASGRKARRGAEEAGERDPLQWRLRDDLRRQSPQRRAPG